MNSEHSLVRVVYICCKRLEILDVFVFGRVTCTLPFQYPLKKWVYDVRSGDQVGHLTIRLQGRYRPIWKNFIHISANRGSVRGWHSILFKKVSLWRKSQIGFWVWSYYDVIRKKSKYPEPVWVPSKEDSRTLSSSHFHFSYSLKCRIGK